MTFYRKKIRDISLIAGIIGGVIGLFQFIMGIASGIPIEAILLSLLAIIVYAVGFAFVANLVYWGWRKIAEWQPGCILVMPIIGWVILLVVKYFIAGFVGYIEFPKAIYKAVKNIDIDDGK